MFALKIQKFEHMKVRLMPRSFMPLTLLKNLANTHFQEIRPNGLQVRMVYKSEWSTSPSGLHEKIFFEQG